LIDSESEYGSHLSNWYNNRGVVYFNRGDEDHAFSDYSQAIQLDPENADAYYNRAVSYAEKGDKDRALADYSESISLDPKDDAYLRRGNLYADRGDKEQALADYSEAIRLNPENGDAYYNRAFYIYAPNGDKDRAIADYDESIRLAPQADAYVQRGNIHANKGEKKHAIADYSEAIRLDPKYVDAYFQRALNTDDKERAIADYSEDLRLNPKDGEAYRNRGGVYASKGDKEHAIADYNEAIRLDPKDAGAYHSRGDIYRDKSDRERALADYQESYRLDGSDSSLADAIADLQKALAEQNAPVAPIAKAAPQVLAGKRVALVIGNGAYKNAPLANPNLDADLVAASLKKSGFDVLEVKDADFSRFDGALTEFAAKESGADIALFYFAGHGFAISDGLKARNYLMSTSVDLSATSPAQFRRDGIPLDEVIDRISAPAKITLAFVDACRNDPFHRGAGDRGFERIEIPLHRQLFIGMSTELGKTAVDGGVGKGSPFAQAFAQVIATPGLRVDDAFRELRSQVSRLTSDQQKPEILQDELERGAFALVPEQ
jgi:tetratricopeptide (TPR) repeat protein